MVRTIQEMLDGTLEPIAYNYGIADDVVKLAPFYQFEESLPQETLDEVQQIIDDIKSGELSIQPDTDEAEVSSAAEE